MHAIATLIMPFIDNAELWFWLDFQFTKCESSSFFWSLYIVWSKEFLVLLFWKIEKLQKFRNVKIIPNISNHGSRTTMCYLMLLSNFIPVHERLLIACLELSLQPFYGCLDFVILLSTKVNCLWRCMALQCDVLLTLCPIKKEDTIFLPVTSQSIQLSQLYSYLLTQQWVCNKVIIKKSTTPHACCCTTL